MLAVEEGRRLYGNIKMFVIFLLSTNIGEMLMVLFAAMLGISNIITPMHLLWINMISDGPPALALSFNPVDVDLMKKPPRLKSQRLMSNWVVFRYLVLGTYIGLTSLSAFIWTNLNAGLSFQHLRQNQIIGKGTSIIQAQTMAITVLIVTELFKAFSSVSTHQSITKISPWKNMKLMMACLLSLLLHISVLLVPSFSSSFGFMPLSLKDWKVFYLKC